MGAARVLEYQSNDVPRQLGELARLRILQGPNEGLIFVMKVSSILVGRDEECDVVIADTKASRKHLRIDLFAGGAKVTDLGSANGILFMGEYVRSFSLQSGQHFTIGETIFEFYSREEATRILNSPFRTPAEVVQLDQAMAQQRVQVRKVSKSVKVAKSKKKTNPMLIVGVIAAGAYFYQDDLIPLLVDFGLIDAPKKVAATKKKPLTEESNQVGLLPPGGSLEVGKTAEQYYRQGFRELRENNYLRAKAQFELALQVNPNHDLSKKGLANADNRIEEEIKRLKTGAQKARTAGRLREARGYYEAAMRMMYQDKTHPEYLECEVELKKLNESLTRGAR